MKEFLDEEVDEDIPRHRPGEFCDNCGHRKDTKKNGKLFLCVDCRKKPKYSKKRKGKNNGRKN